MPLTMVNQEETQVIRKVGGKEETRKFLEGMGFVAGGEVTVLSKAMGNVTGSIKGARIGVGKYMGNKIMV